MRQAVPRGNCADPCCCLEFVLYTRPSGFSAGEVAILKSSIILSALLFSMFSLSLRQVQTPKSATPSGTNVPPEAAREVNPVKPTSESRVQGKKMYGYDCAVCHGKNGDGKGDLAAEIKSKVTDFTDPEALKGRTDGELFYIIKNGRGEMPPEGARAKPKEIWNLVNYVRSFAREPATENK